MTFPHRATGQKTVTCRADHQALLASAIMRQANSLTARAMMLAQSNNDDSTVPERDAFEQRIHYFGSHEEGDQSASGPFSSAHRLQCTGQTECESGVYQNASANIKTNDVDGYGTGEQFNHAGHGASRIS